MTQWKTNALWSNSHMELKTTPPTPNKQTHGKRDQICGCHSGERELDEVGQKVQISSYKITKY